MKLFNSIKVFTHNTIKKGEVVLDEKGPKWAIIGGAALLVASTVVACKQTTKAEAIVTEFHKQQGYIEEAATSDVYKGQYTEEDKKKQQNNTTNNTVDEDADTNSSNNTSNAITNNVAVQTNTKM